MVKNTEDNLIFSDTTEFENRTPMQNLLIDVIKIVNHRMLNFYLTPEARSYNITPSDMLVMVTANLFANLAQNIISPKDVETKISTFNVLNDELISLNKKIFLMLETYYNTDENKIN